MHDWNVWLYVDCIAFKCMIETRRLKNVVIVVQSLALSREIIVIII